MVWIGCQPPWLLGLVLGLENEITLVLGLENEKYFLTGFF